MERAGCNRSTRARLGALMRHSILLGLLLSCTACKTILDNQFGPEAATCDMGSQGSQAACTSVVTAANCDPPGNWDAVSMGCVGGHCKGVEVPVNGISSMFKWCGQNGIYLNGPSALFAQASAGTQEASTAGTEFTPMSIPHWASASGSASNEPVQSPPVSAAAQLTTPTITEYSLPQPGMQPGPIIVSDQGLLFSATATCSGTGCPNYGIWKINPDGTSSRLQQTCFGVPQCRHTGLAPLATGGYCYGITHTFYQGARDPDEIVCVANHSVAEVALRALDGYLADLVLGNDGAIWYTDPQLNGIGRMDGTSHAIRANYLDPGKLYGIAAIANGPDGAMWFTAVYQNQVGRISASAFDLFTVPTTDAQPAGIVTGPDGNVWFTELNGNRIGRVTPAGVFTEFALPTAGAQPLGIIAGPDGALWFTEFNAGQIGRISRWGDITEYPVPTANAQPAGLVTGTDGNIWFTEFQGNKIGKLTVPRPSGAAQVVEFYNSDLDTFFITANAPEAAAIDNGSAGPGWSRTGGTFSAGGGTAVCRFYGSVTPGPNSHFYTADAAECESLKQLQASTPATQKRWNFESLDFNTTPAVNGACAAGLVPVYRAYNNGNVRGVDSNHRITSSTGAIAEVVRRGWSNEGVVMCAPG